MDVKSVKKTPLYTLHQEAGAKFVEFCNWHMPVQYRGLIQEHQTVRSGVGIFDVCHMGEIVVRGKQAAAFLQYATTNDVLKLEPGQAQYSLLLNHTGGVVDDIIVYYLREDEYLLCVNAANVEKDFRWLKSLNKTEAIIENVSEDCAQIAVQGPKSRNLLAEIMGLEEDFYSLANFPLFTFKQQSFSGESVLVARTGYTGEDGFELFIAPTMVCQLWKALLEAGASLGVEPIGLGARDTLRLEVGYPLHGHELRDDVCVASSGLNWAIKGAKGKFVGAEALQRTKEQGLLYRLVGLEVLGPGIIRAEDAVFTGSGEVGWVTSGTKTPTLNKAVGMAFVGPAQAVLDATLEVRVREKRLPVKVVHLPFLKPFYKR